MLQRFKEDNCFLILQSFNFHHSNIRSTSLKWVCISVLNSINYSPMCAVIEKQKKNEIFLVPKWFIEKLLFKIQFVLWGTCQCKEGGVEIVIKEN